MITPAKWQAKGGEKNEAFRRDIVPYMSDIVFYPATPEIFDILEQAGICYHIIDNIVHQNKKIKIVCSIQPALETKGFIDTDCVALVNDNVKSIINKCSNSKIVDKLNYSNGYYVKSTDSGRQKVSEDDIEVWGGLAGGQKNANGQSMQLLGYRGITELYHKDGIDKWKACLHCMPTGNSKYGMFDTNGMTYGLSKILKLAPNQVPKGSYYPLALFDSEIGVDSFVSYFGTKLVCFLVTCSIAGTTMSREFFRFVPDPGKFDHIFTDEELYEKYGLTEEEITIIESVIKERK